MWNTTTVHSVSSQWWKHWCETGKYIQYMFMSKQNRIMRRAEVSHLRRACSGQWGSWWDGQPVPMSAGSRLPDWDPKLSPCFPDHTQHKAIRLSGLDQLSFQRLSWLNYKLCQTSTSGKTNILHFITINISVQWFKHSQWEIESYWQIVLCSSSWTLWPLQHLPALEPPLSSQSTCFWSCETASGNKWVKFFYHTKMMNDDDAAFVTRHLSFLL